MHASISSAVNVLCFPGDQDSINGDDEGPMHVCDGKLVKRTTASISPPDQDPARDRDGCLVDSILRSRNNIILCCRISISATEVPTSAAEATSSSCPGIVTPLPALARNAMQSSDLIDSLSRSVDCCWARSEKLFYKRGELGVGPSLDRLFPVLHLCFLRVSI